MVLPNSLQFAGIPGTYVEVVDVNRHAAEKFHGMTRDHGDRENSRVRDLVDLIILIEHDLLTPEILATAIATVWAERDGTAPLDTIPPLPGTWPDRYERLAADHDLNTRTFTHADALIRQLWRNMFPAQ